MGVMLDTAIGVAFMFLLLSLVCTAVGEAIEHVLKYRAHYLRLGIEKLLLAENAALRDRLFAHPLIKSLYTPSKLSERIRTTGPSYIPSRRFVLALLDLLGSGGSAGSAGTRTANDGGTGEAQAAEYRTPRNVAEVLMHLENNRNLPAGLVGALKTLAADAGDDFEKFKSALERWFDESMDRVTGWYKRRAQVVALAIGLGVAVGLNADTIEVVRTLSADSAVRAALVASAEEYLRENPDPPAGAPAAEPGSAANAAGGDAGAGGGAASDAGGTQSDAGGAASSAPPEGSDPIGNVRERMEVVIDDLGGLGLPIGWRASVDDTPAADATAAAPIDRVRARVWPGWPWSGHWAEQLGAHAIGWLLTAFGLSLGAPFWFDLLGKFMSIRSSTRPAARPADAGSPPAAAAPAAQTVRVEVAAAPPASDSLGGV